MERNVYRGPILPPGYVFPPPRFTSPYFPMMAVAAQVQARAVAEAEARAVAEAEVRAAAEALMCFRSQSVRDLERQVVVPDSSRGGDNRNRRNIMDFARRQALWQTIRTRRQPPQNAAAAGDTQVVVCIPPPKPPPRCETNLPLDWTEVDFGTYLRHVPDIFYCYPPPFVFCKQRWTTIEDTVCASSTTYPPLVESPPPVPLSSASSGSPDTVKVKFSVGSDVLTTLDSKSPEIRRSVKPQPQNLPTPHPVSTNDPMPPSAHTSAPLRTHWPMRPPAYTPAPRRTHLSVPPPAHSSMPPRMPSHKRRRQHSRNRHQTHSPTRLPVHSPMPLRTSSPKRHRTHSPIRLPVHSPMPLRTSSPKRHRTHSPIRFPVHSPVPVPTLSSALLPAPSSIPLPANSPVCYPSYPLAMIPLPASTNVRPLNSAAWHPSVPTSVIRATPASVRHQSAYVDQATPPQHK